MRFHHPLNRRKADTLFSRFCLDMHILPPETPIFLIDCMGRITNRKKLDVPKSAFGSIFGLVSEAEAAFVREQMVKKDAFAVKSKADGGKSYVVVSKDGNGFSRCVVCSYSEKNCIRLHDYIRRLCSYKDYLDSFMGLALSDNGSIPVKRLFRMRISGALELVELASFMGENENSVSFPVVPALEKLGAFAERMNGGRIVVQKDKIDETAAVTVPECFFKLTVSILALVYRHSKSGRVFVSVTKKCENDGVRLCFSAASGRTGKHDIYEDALVTSLLSRGIGCTVVSNDDEYSFCLDVSLCKYQEAVLADLQSSLRLIDGALSQDVLEDMFVTVLGE